MALYKIGECWVDPERITAIEPRRNAKGVVIGSCITGTDYAHIEVDDLTPDEIMAIIEEKRRGSQA